MNKANPEKDKDPIMHPPEPVPVRLDSEPVESASSQGSAEGEEDETQKSQVTFCSPPSEGLYFSMYHICSHLWYMKCLLTPSYEFLWVMDAMHSFRV